MGQVENGGRLGSRKGCNFPGIKVPLKIISERDAADLKFGIDNDVDVVFASFVRNADDVTQIRKLLAGKDILVVSKIEDSFGCKNIDEIIEASDGVLIARGDLGIEIPLEKVVQFFKKIPARRSLV